MVSLFGKLLKVLPGIGAALIAAAILVSLRHGQMSQWSIALIVLGFLLLLAMFLKIEAASLRYYLNLALSATLLMAVLAVAYGLLSNHPAEWDLTKHSLYSLAPQTKKILNNLSKPVEIEVIATTNEPYYSFFKRFADQSDRLSFKVTNPYKSAPAGLAPDEQVKINDIRISSGKKKTQINFRGGSDLWSLEGEILNGILTVIQEKDIRLYFVTRHSEKSPDVLLGTEGDARSMSNFVEQLWKRAMGIHLLDLQTERRVPEDCSLLVIAGPLVDYHESEIQAIRDYLDAGGSLLALIDPPLAEESRLPHLRALLAIYGVNVVPRFVVDNQSFSANQNPCMPIVSNFNPKHPITERLQGLSAGIPMALVSPVLPIDKNRRNLLAMSLMVSSKQGWTMSLDEYLVYAKSKELSFPTREEWNEYSLAVAVSKKPGVADADPKAKLSPRLVVFGDSDFLANARLNIPEATLGYFAVSWLIHQSDLVDIPPRSDNKTPMILDPQQRNMISILSVVVVPFSIFFGGLAYTTIRRRKR